ncbi:MAG: hypothetical protein H0X40_01725 [Chthoniobacterales bacterium]|nr:hypothetical protein [Chthoniobacterales bacterium]
MSKSKVVRVVLYAALIFLAGGVAGAFVAPMIGRTFMRPPRPRELSQHMMERLQTGLNLTADQAAKIQPLVEKVGAEIESIRHETVKHVHERVAETNAQIAQILTPEQRVKFARMEAEHRKRMGHGHPPGEPPPPGPDGTR